MQTSIRLTVQKYCDGNEKPPALRVTETSHGAAGQVGRDALGYQLAEQQ